jgi:CO/xanthine dehydrogenase FAD-binding subunit
MPSRSPAARGAMVRQRALEDRPVLSEELPLLAAALPHIGHREIRNRGTVGGSIAHADPAAELGLIAATLGATIIAQHTGGSREIPAEQFVRGPFQTALEPGELVTAIRWPVARPEDRFAFEEVARRHGDFALCGVAIKLRLSPPQRSARLGLLGVAPAPVVREVQLTSDSQIVAVTEEIVSSLQPSSDMHATADYRRRLARVLLERCLRRALGGTDD